MPNPTVIGVILGGMRGMRTPTFKSEVLYPTFGGTGTTALYAHYLYTIP